MEGSRRRRLFEDRARAWVQFDYRDGEGGAGACNGPGTIDAPLPATVRPAPVLPDRADRGLIRASGSLRHC